MKALLATRKTAIKIVIGFFVFLTLLKIGVAIFVGYSVRDFRPSHKNVPQGEKPN
jgi:hypothetical protein